MLTPGVVEHAAEDAGGAARARHVRARDDRSAEGAADDPLAHAALRVHAAVARPARRSSRRHPRPGRRRGRSRDASTSSHGARAVRARDALSLLDQALAVGGGRPRRPAGASGFRRRRRSSNGSRCSRRSAARTSRARSSACTISLLAVTTSAASPTICSAPCATRSCKPTPRVGCPTTVRPRSASGSRRSPRRWAMPRSCAAIEVMGSAIVDIRGQAVADPRLVLEVAVVRIARREARIARGDTARPSRAPRTATCRRCTGAGGTAVFGTGRRTGVAVGAAPAVGRTRAGRTVLARRRRQGPSDDPPAPGAATPAGEAAPDRGEAAPVTPDKAVFALDDVIEAWPEALALLKAPVRAGIQDAQPIALENGIIVFGVPKIRFDAINDRFRKEAAAIKEAFAPRARRLAALHVAPPRLRRRRRPPPGDRGRSRRGGVRTGNTLDRARTRTATRGR